MRIVRIFCLSVNGGFQRDVRDLTDPEACGAYSLHDQGKAFLSGGLCGSNQPEVLAFVQLALRGGKAAPLEPQRLDDAVLPPLGSEKAVDARQHGIDRCRGAAADQLGFP